MSEITSSSDNTIDPKGYCVHHPAIKLQRRTTSGEWKPLLPNCPLCSLPGRGSPLLRRTTSSISSSGSNHRLSRLNSCGSSNSCRSTLSNSHDDDEKDNLSPLHPGKVALLPPPSWKEMSMMSLSTDRTDTTVASSCSASSKSSGSSLGQLNTNTGSSRRSSTSSLPPISPVSPSSSSIIDSPVASSSYRRSSSTNSIKKSIICGLRYTNPTNSQRGSYTGQLHPESQLPHGIGTLRYTDGSIGEGEWCDGKLVVVDGQFDSESGGGSVSLLYDNNASARSMSRSRGRVGREEESGCGSVLCASSTTSRARSRGRDRGEGRSIEETYSSQESRTRHKSRSSRRGGSEILLRPELTMPSLGTPHPYEDDDDSASYCASAPGPSFGRQEDTANTGSSSVYSSSYSRRQESGQEISNVRRRNRVEVSCLPCHFEQDDGHDEQQHQRALIPYLNSPYQEEEESDDDDDDNSLGTCEKSHYGKYSRRSCTATSRSGSIRVSSGPYSARESKGSLLSSSCSSTAKESNLSRSRSRHALEK